MANSPKRALIVGATGQVGAHLVEQLGDAAVPTTRGAAMPDELHLELAQAAADPAGIESLLAEQRIDAVYCAAGATNVERCESDHAWADAANHLGPAALARAARHLPFVFFSTDYVFDGVSGPYREEDEPHPLSVYGNSKLDGERAVLEAHPQALVLRTTTVYGPDPQGKNFLYTLRKVLASGGTMRVPTDQLATPTYNADLAAAAIALVARGASGIFHVTGPDFLSRLEFAEQAAGILGLDITKLHGLPTSELDQKAARPLLGGLRSDKLTQTLGPVMRPLSQGIRDWQRFIDAEEGRA